MWLKWKRTEKAEVKTDRRSESGPMGGAVGCETQWPLQGPQAQRRGTKVRPLFETSRVRKPLKLLTPDCCTWSFAGAGQHTVAHLGPRATSYQCHGAKYLSNEK